MPVVGLYTCCWSYSGCRLFASGEEFSHSGVVLTRPPAVNSNASTRCDINKQSAPFLAGSEACCYQGGTSKFGI
eukprot:2727980-Alexandrium_andersonii.AAC.1